MTHPFLDYIMIVLDEIDAVFCRMGCYPSVRGKCNV
ncbi:hypothetical protein IX308_001544 [Porphyromonas levii]|nr:hypothetical protein [Porphyromonas levii]MBR8714955.1 hypothetical protein [Porphyromonas levii]MBR8727404.1 hypothetical protein [Porphyromonas levii]MBR8735739.1 hypothetical protein [Porphyromonas levii]MBR8760194.1 hypothetical protein [Porphyromonas levii]